ncbi:tumor necrosis factor receptor superfamily member EDAR-like [Cebidichthys violaceus]|uniref:tumor necrosis factor receptor superfamily member EDAR-like n=1 Tax=Cebidichthys violaceus TaxID=271503 RepID=UPI0035CA5427
MNSFSMEASLSASLLMLWCVLVHSEPSCDQTEFLHTNGTCVSCPVCGPGEQLSEDCGFGDGGEGVCILCGEGKFSADTGVAPCMRCTQCNLLNRLKKTACSPTRDAQCGRCLPGYYELRSMTGEVELPCVPCYRRDTVHQECLLLTAHGSKGDSGVTAPRGNLKEPKEKKQLPEYCPGPEGLLSVDDLQYTPLSGVTERAAEQSDASSRTLIPAQDPLRGLNSLSHDNEVHPTSIVINVTTNIKPSGQKEENIAWEAKQRRCYSMEEMEQKLQTIWEVAQGQSIEMLDYDSVQDLSLLLDSADNGDVLRRLGRSLGVPPQVNAHLRGFQDLFQYLRTSTYTLLPQLAQAAALLPNPQVVATIHRAVVNK